MPHLSPNTQPRPSTRLLVSVRDAAEAAVALGAGAGLIDAKDPEAGALGALPAATVRAILATVAGRAATSAVAGEPPDPSALPAAVARMAETGADYVKAAVGPAARAEPERLRAAAAAAPGRLIAVLFAEDGLDLDAVPTLAAAGFCGAMIDTAGKSGGGLTRLLPEARLAAFVAACRDHGLLCGLAGSLQIADIPRLAALGPAYLGFRGGLCRGGDRRMALDPFRVAQAVAALGALRDAA